MNAKDTNDLQILIDISKQLKKTMIDLGQLSAPLLYATISENELSKIDSSLSDFKDFLNKLNLFLTNHQATLNTANKNISNQLEIMHKSLATLERNIVHMQFLQQHRDLVYVIDEDSPHPRLLKDQWTVLGHGTYNLAFKKDNQVFKVQRRLNDRTDTPERAVRLWNIINPNLEPAAQLATHNVPLQLAGKTIYVPVDGWVLPFVEGQQASQEDIQQKLLEIYTDTGRIIFDAIAANNFLKTTDGQIVCIDIGLALEMDRRESATLVGLSRKPSLDSLQNWDSYSTTYINWLKNNQSNYPIVIDTVKALLLIKMLRPDIVDVTFLTPKLIGEFSKAFDDVSGSSVNAKLRRQKAIATLESIQSPKLESLKQFCRNWFQSYLESYALRIDGNDEVSPNDRDSELSHFSLTTDALKINAMVELMKAINRANTQDECITLINTAYQVYQNAFNEYAIGSKESSELNFSEISFTSEEEPVFQELRQQEFIVQDLDSLKKKCQEILKSYLEVKGFAFITEPQKLAHYKISLIMNRTYDQCRSLIKDIDQVQRLDELMALIETFEKKLPVLPPENALTPSFNALLDVVGKCKIAVAAASESIQLNQSDAQDSGPLTF